MITYEKRVNQIKTVDDIDKQLQLAKQYSQRLRREFKAMPTLALKLEKMTQQREAERVVQKLRSNLFDLEDAVRAANFTA